MVLEIFDSKGRRYTEEQIAAIHQHLESGHKDTEAMDQIHQCMNQVGWDADTLDAIAGIVRATGRPVEDPA